MSVLNYLSKGTFANFKPEKDGSPSDGPGPEQIWRAEKGGKITKGDLTIKIHYLDKDTWDPSSTHEISRFYTNGMGENGVLINNYLSGSPNGGTIVGTKIYLEVYNDEYGGYEQPALMFPTQAKIPITLP